MWGGADSVQEAAGRGFWQGSGRVSWEFVGRARWCLWEDGWKVAEGGPDAVVQEREMATILPTILGLVTFCVRLYPQDHIRIGAAKAESSV